MIEKKYDGVAEEACLNDTEQIYQLVKCFADQDMMLHREKREICESIGDFLVYRSNEAEGVLGCAALHQLGDDLAEIRAVAVWERSQRYGIGKALVQACLEKAEQMYLSRVFLLTYRPEVFGRLGFKEVDISTIPEKLQGECAQCPKNYPACGEIAMIYHKNP